MEGQTHEDALTYNPIVYQRKGLLVPSCRIPIPVIRTMFDKESYYVAQVTAHARDANMERSFVMIEHNGMSEPLTFRFKKDTDKSDLKPLIESKEESATSSSSEGNESDE
jgi:hypothetical protein